MALEGRSDRTRAGSITIGIAAVVAAVWGEVLIAAPIVAVSRSAGPATAFGVFAVAYTAIGWVLAVAALAAHRRLSTGGSARPSRLAARLGGDGGRRARFGARALRAGRVSGFVLASVTVGGAVTTWLLLQRGRTDGILGLAAASSAIFAVVWVAVYAGLFSALR